MARRKGKAPVNREKPSTAGWILGIKSWDRSVDEGLKSFEGTGFFRAAALAAAVVTFVSVIYAIVAFNQEFAAREQERKIWQQDRIDRAWDDVLRPITGNTGKGRALNKLIEAGEDINGLDLSCEKMGGFVGGKCKDKVELDALKIYGQGSLVSYFNDGDLLPTFEVRQDYLPYFLVLSDTYIKNAYMENVEFRAKMERTELTALYMDNVAMSLLIDSRINFARIRDSTIYFKGELQIDSVTFAGETLFFSGDGRGDLKVANSIFPVRQLPKCRGFPGGGPQDACPLTLLQGNRFCDHEASAADNFEPKNLWEFFDNSPCAVGRQRSAVISFEEAARRYPEIFAFGEQ